VSERREDDDVAWLLARAKGEPGPSISPARAARYEKLEALIGELPAQPGEAVPPPDWQERVFAAVDATQASEAHGATGVVVWILRRRSWLIGIVGAAAAAALVWAIISPGDRPPAIARGPLVHHAVEPAPSNLGAMGPALVGDTLVVSASVDGPGELRVYDDERREAGRCAAATHDCAFGQVGTRTQMQLRVRLERRGVYTSLVFAPPLGGPSEGLDLDVARAAKAQIATGRAQTDPVQ
jgi:hypothetical protein